MEQNPIYITEKFISLEKVIASKNKHLLMVLPKFMLNWFKKLIYLDRINSIIYKYRDTQGVDFAGKVLEDIGVKVNVVNLQNIPRQNSRCIVAGNHPLGGVDGMAIMNTVGQVIKDILFPVNDILCALPELKGVFVSINKYGRNSGNHDAFNNAFASDSCVLFFPAGTESKIIKGKVQDFPWKKTFINKAVQYKRDVVPVLTQAKNSACFYRLGRLRMFFGIKFDFEMILLPREMFAQQGKEITLVFGKPISYQTFDNRYTHTQWAQKVRDYVYELDKNPNAEFKIE
jgi:Putative hemolysin